MLNGEIGNAALRVQLPGLDGLRGTRVNAARACAARVACHRLAWRQMKRRDNFAQHNPTAHACFANQKRVLSNAAKASALRVLALQNGRGVHAHSKAISWKAFAQVIRDGLQALTNDAVIVAAARVAGNAATRRNMVMQLVWLAACVAIGHANNGARRWHKLVRIHALLYVLAEVGHFAATNFSQPLRKVRAVRSFIGAANSIQRKARASQRGKNFTRQRMVNFAVIYSVFMAHGAPRIWCHA